MLGRGWEGELITSQLTLDLQGSYVLRRRLSIGVDLPLFLYNGSSISPQARQALNLGGSVRNPALGDLTLITKYSWYESRDRDLRLGLALPLTLPTGSRGSFVGEEFLTLSVLGVVDYRISDLLLALNFGVRIREDQTLASLNISDQILVSLAGEYPVWKQSLFTFLEMSTYADTSRPFEAAGQSRWEGDLGARYLFGNGFQAMGGLGTSTGAGYGSVGTRLFLALTYAQALDLVDRDGDGLSNDLDPCPAEPEDPDGFQDDDGCPDLDNDGDGVPDELDICPMEAGVNTNQGCPDISDSDGDGVEDELDPCPKQAEDRDGYEDDDGCPDPDNDGDGFADGVDRCPLEPENRNGLQDDDGCPDAGTASVTGDKIVISRQIFFRSGKADILSDSLPVLDDVADIMKRMRNISLLEIQGHTDNQGQERTNRRLSEKRARAVLNYLVRRGVEKKRLRSSGFGSKVPLKDNSTPEGRMTNRRVEFKIIKQATH